MKKLVLLFFFIAVSSSAQYVENAPWMQDLTKNQPLTGKQKIKGYTLDQLTNAFDEYWKNKDWKKKGSGFKPFKRWENYWKYQVDSDGYLPSPQKLLNSWKTKASGALKQNPTSDWSPLGPMRPGTLANALSGTGRLNAIAVDPNDSNIWYAGAPSGGIWKSTDAGENWVTLFDEFLQIGVSGIAIDPNDSNIIYIATGDDDAADSFSAGVFKSTDGGATWNETALGASFDENWDNSRIMSEISIDPTNSDIVWVGTSFGLFKSIDAGVTWESKLSGNIKEFRFKPNDPNTVYTVTDSRFFRSTDGENFEQITSILPTVSGRLVLDVTPANPEVVYILSAKTRADDYEFQGFYKSVDGGLTFTESPNTTNIMESNQAWFDLAIAVSPTNENEVYMGCLNIWKSLDGGNSFSRVNEWFNDNQAYTHADIHTLKFFNNILYACTDGGLYTSDDGGISFTDRTGNMEITQFYRISVAKNDASRTAGGTQDNSGYVGNDTEWNIFTSGDGMDYEIDPTNKDIIYGFPQFGQALFITENGGNSVGQAGAPIDANGARISGNWITPLAIDSEGTVYAGYDALYRLEGRSWEKVSADIGSSSIEDIEIDPNDPRNIYIAEGDFLYRSQNAGQTFVPVRSFNTIISDIAINNTNGDIIYLTTSARVGIDQASQPGERKVFKVDMTQDETIVTDITLNLPADQAYFCIVHQARNTTNPIYVGTNLGVYRLDDTLPEWEEYSTGMPNTTISDLEINTEEELIVASTYGRGAFKSPIPVETPESDIRLLSVTPKTNKILCGEVVPAIEVENKGSNGITAIQIDYTYNDNQPQSFVWNGDLASGNSAEIDLPAFSGLDFGKNAVLVTIDIENDAYSDNNSQSIVFDSNQFASGDQLFDFEENSPGLLTENVNENGVVWERGVPTGTLLNEASSGTQVYATNLDGNHSDGVKAHLISGCYELSSIIAPKLKFSMAYDLEPNFDVVYVEYSLDDGIVWNVLGKVASMPNWYTSDRTNLSSGEDDDCQNCPGAQWTGTNSTMTEYSYDFVMNASLGEEDLTNESNIIFRIVFHSDPAVNQEGVIIDDFIIEGFQDDDDDDNDGILDVDDNCPLLGNADQADNDQDGEGDVCDPDDDNDGILDSEDNCPFTANADQADTDNDGIGDVCDEDQDNDGVPDAFDQCPDTPTGEEVDTNGCPIFTLPNDNFLVQTQGLSCRGSKNGTISVEAQSDLNYLAVLNGAGETLELQFTDNTTFDGLAPGSYELCISVEGETSYAQCFDLNIGEPEALSVKTEINSTKNEVIIRLEGGDLYTITLNNKVYQTRQGEIRLPLDKLENTLNVKTDLECQGAYAESIFLEDEMMVYPNPVTEEYLNLFVGNTKMEKVNVTIFSSSGRKMMSKDMDISSSTVRLNLGGFSSGIYLINVKDKSITKNFKILIK